MSSTDVSGKPPSEEYALQTLPGSHSNSAGSPVHLKTANGDSNITVNKPPSKPKKSPLFPLTEGGSERFKLWQYFELSVLIVLIVVVWVLLFIPFIFYHIPSPGVEEEQQVVATCQRNYNNIYNGRCRDTLASLQSCLPNETSSDVYIAEGLDVAELESQISALEGGLGVIQATPKCVAVAIPFLCLYLFGVCDASGRYYQPPRNDCISISTDICKTEWIAATTFNLPLPQCEILPNVGPICSANSTGTNSTMTANSTTFPTESGINTSVANNNASQTCFNSPVCPFPCSEGFYCDQSTARCLPLCKEWNEYPRSTEVATDVVVILSACIGVISATVVLVLSCVRWKRMFVFPTFYVIYSTATLLLFAIFVLISYVDRNGLYCSSCDLRENSNNPTPFCIIAGVVFYYVILQIAIWWFCHVAVLFWKIRFPFHAKHFESARRFKYVHIVTVAVGLFVPTVPIIAQFIVGGSKEAFSQSRYPPILCGGQNRDIAFYGVALPIMLLLQVGVTLLIVIFWGIHKQHGLFKMKMSQSPFKISTAERKILIVFVYYIFLGVFALTSFTLGAKVSAGPRSIDAFTKYFLCEAAPNPAETCERGYLAYDETELFSVAIVLLALFPVVNLIFTIDTKEAKKFFGLLRGKLHITSTREQPSASVISASTALSQTL